MATFINDFSDFLGPRGSRAARQARLWPGHLAAHLGCYLARAAVAAALPIDGRKAALEWAAALTEIKAAAQAALEDGTIIPSWPEEFWAAAEAAQDGPAQLRALGGFLEPDPEAAGHEGPANGFWAASLTTLLKGCDAALKSVASSDAWA